MAHRRWHRVDDPWDTLPSPDHLDPRASALQVGEHLWRVRADAALVISVEEALDLAVRRGFDEVEQETVLRHMAGGVSDPFVITEVPFWVPGDVRPKWSLPLPDCDDGCTRWLLNPRTGNDFAHGTPCNYWSCDVCGQANAWTKVAEANFRFESVDGLWVASAPTDAATTDRIRQRRHDHQPARDLMVRRRDGVKYLYVDVDLSGDEPPVDGEWMVVDDALRHLQDVALSPPSAVEQARWSQTGWPALPENIPPGGNIDLGEFDLPFRNLVLEEVRQRAIVERGVDPNDEKWRKQVRGPWLAAAIRSAVERNRSDGWGQARERHAAPDNPASRFCQSLQDLAQP